MELQHHGGHEQSPQEDQPEQGTADCSIESVRLYNNNILFYSILLKLFYFMLNDASIYNMVPVSVKVALPGLTLCQCTPWSH